MNIKLKGLSQGQIHDLLPDGIVLLGYRGSVAHGTYTPSYGGSEHDDKDIMGVMIAPIETYLGLQEFKQRERTITGSDGVVWDSVVYEIRKYVRLLLKSNPNVLSLLWLPEHLYIYVSEMGQELINHRNMFLTKQAYHSYVGYSKGQLHRMTHINTSDLGAKRKELVRKFSFDCKNGAHLIRLLRMGIEFLTDGEMHIVREDAAELKEIKNGEWSLEKVLKESDRLFALAQEAYIHSPLPPKPDREGAERLLVKLLSKQFKIRKG